jgi:hypothetical protein
MTSKIFAHTRWEAIPRYDRPSTLRLLLRHAFLLPRVPLFILGLI